jgi:hypothetical protein
VIGFALHKGIDTNETLTEIYVAASVWVFRRAGGCAWNLSPFRRASAMRDSLRNSAVLATALGFATLGGQAQAVTVDSTATIHVTQVGPNVVVTGSGEIDLSGLTFDDSGDLPTNGIIWPDAAEIIVGPASFSPAGVDVYTGATGPATMGSGGEMVGDSATGVQFGVGGNPFDTGVLIFVPEGYTSGTPLSGTATFDGTTLAKLGITPGTYTFTWGDPSSLTVEVSVPEPTTWAMMLMGFAGIGLLAYRKRGTPATA